MFSLFIALTYKYAFSVQHDPDKRWFVILFTICDIIANYTELALLFWSFPKKSLKEYTFSKHLPRLVHLPDWRGKFALKIALKLNVEEPNHVDINKYGKLV